MAENLDVLHAVQAALGYSFRDPQLLVAALTHASTADSRLHSNERLEFLGDAILGMVVCLELYHQFPDYLEGELTKIKSAVVSRQTCARIARDLGLMDHVFVGKGMGGRSQLPQSLAAALYEAVIAAIYLDAGDLQPAREFILRTMMPHIREAAASQHQFNYKSQLQQYAQKMLSGSPCYELLDEKGPDHSKCFEIRVVVGGRRFPPAWGPSKKEAEQKAAYMALRELGNVLPHADYEPEAGAEPPASGQSASRESYPAA